MNGFFIIDDVIVDMGFIDYASKRLIIFKYGIEVTFGFAFGAVGF